MILVDMKLCMHFSYKMLYLLTAYRNQNKNYNILSRLEITIQSKN